jgi:hypothetical protein
MWLELVITALFLLEILNVGMRCLKLSYIMDDEKEIEMDPQVRSSMYS